MLKRNGSATALCWGVLALVCHAQPAAPAASGAPPAAAAPQPPPTTFGKPHFWKRMFTLEAVGPTVPAALLEQAQNWPHEWGGRAEGFGKRNASLYGQFVIGTAFEDMTRLVHEEDTTYHRLGKGNFFARTYYAIKNTYVARRPDGGPTFAYSLVPKYYGSWAIATLWSPSRFRTARSIFGWGSEEFALAPSGNFVREFWPDVKSALRKLK